MKKLFIKENRNSSKIGHPPLDLMAGLGTLYYVDKDINKDKDMCIK